jgi:malonate transporter and related proteins
MSHAALLLPDFLLIIIGFLLCRHTRLDESIWQAVERLVYFLLFPVLLFNSILRAPLPTGSVLNLAGSGLAIMLTGIGLAYALGRFRGVDKLAHASGAQVAFRFNSYVALALAERMGGAPGVAAIALIVAIAVPVANVAAVYPLARHGGHGYLRELARNPLILSTVAGLLGNLLGLEFPESVATSLQRIGLAALPLGLMTVGAGLRVGALRDAPALAAGLLGIRHLVLPVVGVLLCLWVPLSPVQQLVVVSFAAMPTASSCYVLAVQLGGNGRFVSGLVTLSTLLGMVSVPLALTTLEAWGR